MEVKGETISKDIKGATDIEVVSLSYDLDKLKVMAESSKGSALVTFKSVDGFRVLDEGDLLEFWPTLSTPNGWLFEVEVGGWKQLESTRSGFISSDNQGLREFLLTGQNDCVSILSFETPTIEYQ